LQASRIIGAEDRRWEVLFLSLQMRNGYLSVVEITAG
jgi:hypothetical protein